MLGHSEDVLELIKIYESMKKFAKLLLSAFVFYSRLFRLIRLYNNLLGKRLTILMFHRITKNDNGFAIDGLPTISISSKNFESLIKFVKNHYHIISLQEYLQCVRNQVKLAPNSLIFSFDDGYKEILVNALPLLKKYKIPAILFVPTSVIDEGGFFWWDVFYLLTNNAQNLPLTIDDSLDSSLKHYLQWMNQLLISSNRNKLEAINDVIEILQNAPEEIRVKIIDYIFEISQNSQFMRNLIPSVLNWEDIKILFAEGMAIGSHTQSHRFLSTMSEEKVIEELTASKHKLESLLKHKVYCFSYPGGKYTNRTADLVKSAGYACACTTNPGLNSRDDNLYELKRVNIWDGTVTNFRGMFSKSLTAWHLFLKN